MAIQNFTIQIILTLTAIDLKFGHSQNMEINRYFYADIKKKNIKKKLINTKFANKTGPFARRLSILITYMYMYLRQ